MHKGDILIMSKLNKKWADDEYRENRMINYMVMRKLQNMKRSFLQPIDLERGKIDRIINGFRSSVSDEFITKVVRDTGMDIKIFTGEKRFEIFEDPPRDANGYVIDSDKKMYLTKVDWEKFIKAKWTTFHYKRDNKGYDSTYEKADKICLEFAQVIDKYLKKIIKGGISNIEDEQLRKYVYFISAKKAYDKSYVPSQFERVTLTLEAITIKEIGQLNDKQLSRYINALKKQCDKATALQIIRKD